MRDGRHARWDEHREQRRRLILDAAIAVVEDSPPGAELRLHDVAARAGLVRTVVQRHFGGRLSLARAVQDDVVEQAFALITGPVDFEDTLYDLASAIVGQTVHWVAAHPNLHALIERELGDGEPSALSRAVDTYADYLKEIVVGVARARDRVLTAVEVAEVRLLFVGVIGQVRATVAHWVSTQPHVLTAEQVQHVLADAITATIVRLGESLGVTLRADQSLVSAV